MGVTRTGGYIGRRAVPTSTSAGGIWQLSEVEAARRASIWPNADALWGSTQLLLHCNGTNNSTTFTDSSSNGFSVTATADAKISTAQQRFGTGSLALDGTGDLLSLASNAAWALPGDFTVEAFVRFNALPTNQATLFNVSTSGGFSLYYTTPTFFGAGPNALILSNRSANVFVISWTPATATWYHVAVCRSGTSIRLFIDGSQVGSTATSSTSFSQAALTIGGSTSDGTAWTINGWIDEIRWTKAARYTSNFTAPTSPFPG